jgi:hypothetical protein
MNKPDENLKAARDQLRQAVRILNRLIKDGKTRTDPDVRSKLGGVEALCNVVIMRVK